MHISSEGPFGHGHGGEHGHSHGLLAPSPAPVCAPFCSASSCSIFISACVAFGESVERLLNPRDLTHLWALAGAGVIGFLGNEAAAWVRLRAGKRLQSPALIADGYYARTDGIVSLAVVASTILVALGLQVADPVIGIAVTCVILRITWQSFITVHNDPPARSRAEH